MTAPPSAPVAARTAPGGRAATPSTEALLRVVGRRGPWARLDLELGAGLHGLVAPPALLDTLARACAGLSAGDVRVAIGAARLDPATGPGARLLLDVALRDEPPWSPAPAPMPRSPALAGRSSSAVEVLEALGLGALLARAAGSLTAPERRTLALALALGAPRGPVVVVTGPFDADVGLPAAWIEERCAALAADHVVWLLAAQDPLRRFGRAPLAWHPGGWVGPGARAGFSPGGLRRTLRLRVAGDAGRELAVSLLADPAVLAAGVDAADPSVVIAQGTDASALSLATLGAAERLGLTLESLSLVALDAAVERVTLEAVARAAFEVERARRAAGRSA